MIHRNASPGPVDCVASHVDPDGPPQLRKPLLERCDRPWASGSLSARFMSPPMRRILPSCGALATRGPTHRTDGQKPDLAPFTDHVSLRRLPSCHPVTSDQAECRRTAGADLRPPRPAGPAVRY